MQQGKVRQVKGAYGLQKKKDGGTYGPAHFCDVELEGGEIISVLFFNEKHEGEQVQLEKNGQYWNEAKKSKSSTADPELKEQLNRIESKLDKLLGMDEPTKTIDIDNVPDRTPSRLTTDKVSSNVRPDLAQAQAKPWDKWTANDNMDEPPRDDDPGEYPPGYFN